MNDKVIKTYKQHFNTLHITGLVRCANQSNTIHIFVHEDLGMKVKMKAGDLGDVTVYIKSKEIIEDELDEEKLNKEDISNDNYQEEMMKLNN